jgi:hypothetical protein
MQGKTQIKRISPSFLQKPLNGFRGSATKTKSLSGDLQKKFLKRPALHRVRRAGP